MVKINNNVGENRMQAAMKYVSFVLIIASILIFPQIAFSGDIDGRIGVLLKNGDVKYGAKVDVFLTTKEILIASVGKETQYKNKYIYEKAILKSLFRAFKQVQNEMASLDYTKQTTRTDFDGKFKFRNVSPGKYFIVVTFPTTIAMHKVFWQVPVVIEKENIEIELSNDNMTLPPLEDSYSD